jgi:diguanylate cyclase (GGDEF)-like protein
VSFDSYEALIQFLYHAPIGLVQTTLDGAIEMINPMSAQLLMPLSGDGTLANLFTALNGVAPELRQMAAAFDQPNGVICESFRIELKAGLRPQAAPQILSINLLKLAPDRLFAALSDATREQQREQRGLAQQLDDVSRIDSLTQMPNRAAVLERIQQVLARPAAGGIKLAVLFINCDRFRRINDTLGNSIGDELLRLMAERLRSTLRSHSRETGLACRMAARTGADEFVVVIDELWHDEDVHTVARRLLSVLSEAYRLGPQQVHCNFSIGVLLRTPLDGDAESALQDASIAMMEAKRAGGSRYVVFERQMQAAAALRGSIETQLRTALAAQQLVVVYQPVVGLQGDFGTDRSAGVEALVRWQHPLRGLLAPMEFIDVAEESGLICPIGDVVLKMSCIQFVSWQAELGALAPRSLAVNVSRAQLRQAGFVASVHEVLRSTGMNPRHLQFEVTESQASQDASVIARLHELKALGLTVALDDFGTGYSSLACLHQLPVDTVKIDRSFISQADSSLHHHVLIEATVRVAHSLGMNTVAEGIETAAQAAVVRKLGCEKGQGYLFSRPLSSVDLAAWLMIGEPRSNLAMAGLGGSR